MRKLVFARIPQDSLKTVYSSARLELQSLAYGGKVFYEGGELVIQGRDNVKRFVIALKKEISEARSLFKDAESLAEFQADEQFLDSLLKVKAS
jgi:hypothetical protein